MARIFSHPFRLEGSVVATVEQATDDAHAEQLAVLILTRPGERPMVPTFGVTDPAFGELDVGEVTTGTTLFGPPVNVVAVDHRYVDDGHAEVDVIFESAGAAA